MEVADPDTGELRYVPMPCGSTIESVCGPCARKARALRMAQCREGWHLTEEPTFHADEPTTEQQAHLTMRADLVAQYRAAVETNQATTPTNCGRPSETRTTNFGNWECGAVCRRRMRRIHVL
jgi:hypothetical protein